MGTSLRNIRQHCIHRFRSRVSRIDRETVYRLHPRNGRYCIPSQGYYIPTPFLSKFPENFSTINFPWILSNQIKRIHHKLLIRLREFRKKIRNNKLDSFIDTKREFTLSISFEDFPLRAKPLPLLRKRGRGEEEEVMPQLSPIVIAIVQVFRIAMALAQPLSRQRPRYFLTH